MYPFQAIGYARYHLMMVIGGDFNIKMNGRKI